MGLGLRSLRGLRDLDLFRQRGPSDKIPLRLKGRALKLADAQTKIEKLIERGEPFERLKRSSDWIAPTPRRPRCGSLPGVHRSGV